MIKVCRIITVEKGENLERNSLVKKVVVHLHLRIGFEVIRHKHDGDLNMAQLVYLERTRNRRDSVTGYLLRVRVFKCESNVVVTRYGRGGNV